MKRDLYAATNRKWVVRLVVEDIPAPGEANASKEQIRDMLISRLTDSADIQFSVESVDAMHGFTPSIELPR